MGITRENEVERVRKIFIGMFEVAWLRCGPASEAAAKNLQLCKSRTKCIIS